MRQPHYATQLVTACLLLLLAPLASAQATGGIPPQDVRIEAGELTDALQQYIRLTDVQLIYRLEQVRGLRTDGSTGADSHDAVIADLLRGTGLTLSRDPSGAMAIVAPRPEPGAALPGANRHAGIEEVIVTGQKRAERLQDVPIAISAFSMDDLDTQKIEGGFDLLKAIPNVTFSKTNFTGYNFQIRGIGTQAVSATTDPGVAVSMNNTTLIVNRLFEQEYLDIERVEVLRGPQGTLYGRNATAGVINLITAKPVIGEESGELRLEAGNYNAQRLRGHYNLPLGETLAARIAYAQTERDGFATNLFDGSDVDNRDLWTGRLSLGWEPSERLRVNFMWERFQEDDERVRSTKQLCHRDEGPTAIAGLNLLGHPEELAARRTINQGCLAKNLFSPGAFTTPNGDALPFVTGGRDNGFVLLAAFSGYMGPNPWLNDPDAPCAAAARFDGMPLVDRCFDVFAHDTQSSNLREIYSIIRPTYRAKADVYDLSLDFQWSDALLFSSQTVWVDDTLYSTQDYGRFETSAGMFNDTRLLGVGSQYYDLAPDGIFCDPQLGCSDSLLIQDMSRATSRQFNQEFRLVSSFEAPVNFSIGANYTRFQTWNDYFVFSNLFTALSQTPPFNGPAHRCTLTGGAEGCIYIDPNSLHEINGEGHNYFRSANPYKMDSAGVFGELYWQITDGLKLTAGLRYTWDRKVFTPIPSQTLLPDYRQGTAADQGMISEGSGPEECISLLVLCGIVGNAPGGRGYPVQPNIVQAWREPTGRIVLDWQPDVGFTDETMVYASYSRGYKAGGANPPGIAPPAGIFIDRAQSAVSGRTFEPEYVNAYEVGAKNTLLGGLLMLNGSAFYYDYEGYQVSKIVNRSAANENFDAKVWGAELEAIFAPSLHWQFNAAIGWLQTEVAKGERSIDLMDRVQGGKHSYQTTIANPHYGADPATVSGVGANQTQNEFLVFDDWVVLKPNPTQTANCVAPAELVALVVDEGGAFSFFDTPLSFFLNQFCAGGSIIGGTYAPGGSVFVGMDMPQGLSFTPLVDAPNGGAGFFADLGGNELPNSPEFTVALGGQFNFDLTRNWQATARVDYYWQGKSYARVYNTDYDRLKAWSNTNFSFIAQHPRWGLTVEAYIKNLFDETPITGTFLNSDDTGLTTNIFTLDPRLVGVSITKRF